MSTPTPQPMNESFRGGAAYVDGQVVPIAEAKISLLDWGFLHSDATYDVAHVRNGAFFRLDDHLDRFENGMTKLKMQLPMTREGIRDCLLQCVRASGLQDAYVEMICTRGTPTAGSRDPRSCRNQFFAFAVPYVSIANPSQLVTGMRLHISGVRRIDPRSVDPTVKNYHWLDLVRGLFDAYDHGQETVVLTDDSENVIEGPGFNIFALIDGTWVTPASGALEGITRKSAMEAARWCGYPVEARALPAAQLRRADEAFATSTAGGIMPIGWVDGCPLGREVNSRDSQTRRIQERYWAMHEEPEFRFSAY